MYVHCKSHQFSDATAPGDHPRSEIVLMQKFEDAGDPDVPKKKKQSRDAEKMAVELSRILFSPFVSKTMKVDKNVVTFSKSARQSDRQCTWKDNKSSPCYCKNAVLKFESHLPDRKYLTRYSVKCRECYGEDVAATHLYCTYCDEVLTGSIAGPGGKISDHLITIRHVYQQAQMVKRTLEDRNARDQDFEQAKEYIVKLEQWSEKIRYPMRTSIKKIHFEDVINALQLRLEQHNALPRAGGEVGLTLRLGLPLLLSPSCLHAATYHNHEKPQNRSVYGGRPRCRGV